MLSQLIRLAVQRQVPHFLWQSFILSRLYNKVHEILGQCWGPLILSNVLARLSMSSFVHKVFAIESWKSSKTEQM